MSGFLTARFLLHLRRWVAESNGEDEDSWEARMPLEILQTIEDPDGAGRSIVDEFGEDPVARERRRKSVQV